MENRQVRVTKRSLDDDNNDPLRDHESLSPAERIELVWELTRLALAVQGRTDAEPPLSRHIVSVYRREG